MNYYKQQLNRVNPTATEFAPTIKIFANGNGTDTNNLSLNNESARALINWLSNYFPEAAKPILYTIEELEKKEEI